MATMWNRKSRESEMAEIVILSRVSETDSKKIEKVSLFSIAVGG